MSKRRNSKRLFVALIVCVGLIVVGSGGFYAYLRMTGNVHVVEQGVFYRSGQLSAEQINQVVSAYGIRSVLNLRGSRAGEDWYDGEIAACDTRHVTHYDFGLSAERFVPPAQAEEILQIIRAAPKPILVHCKAGSDRAGLMSALYRYTQGATAADADRELSIRFGHIPFLLTETGEMDKSFDAYVKGAAK